MDKFYDTKAQFKVALRWCKYTCLVLCWQTSCVLTLTAVCSVFNARFEVQYFYTVLVLNIFYVCSMWWVVALVPRR